MPPSLRLPRAEVIRILAARAPRERGRYCDLVHAPAVQGPRVAVVVPKKALPRAVDRVRVRRRVRAVLASLLRPHTCAVGIVCVLRASALDASTESLAADIGALVERVRLPYNTRI